MAELYLDRIGGENLAVAQNAYAVTWFKEKEINMVFGLLLSVARLVSRYTIHHEFTVHSQGSTVNMNSLGPIYDLTQDSIPQPNQRLAFTLWIGMLHKHMILISIW